MKYHGLAWITNSISSEIAERILWMEYTHEDIFRILELQEEIYTLRQGNQNITQYLTTLNKMWRELDKFLPTHICSCVIPCSCSLQGQRSCPLVFKGSERSIYTCALTNHVNATSTSYKQGIFHVNSTRASTYPFH